MNLLRVNFCIESKHLLIKIIAPQQMGVFQLLKAMLNPLFFQGTAKKKLGT